MKVLTLQIKRIYIDEILAGTKTEEIREIRPNAYSKRYQTYDEENGYLPIKYDALRLIAGRRKNAAEITVAVTGELFEYFEDENGELETYELDGEEWLYVNIVYQLGEVLEVKNITLPNDPAAA